MRVLAIFALPLFAGAFAPIAQPGVRRTVFTRDATLVSEPQELHDFNDNVSKKIQTVLEKADDLLLKRAMRFVNHAPIIVTLTALLKQVGSTRFGLDIAPSALSIASPAGLAVPTWVGYALPTLCVAQVAAVLRSSLAANQDELSQEDISAMAVSNFALARALGDATTTNWLIAAVASGYYARSHPNEETTLSNLSIQITSSLAAVASVLGVTAKIPQVVPFLQGQEQVTALVGLMAYLGLATRDGNGKVKKVVNGVVMGGVLVSKVASGALNLSNLLRFDTIVTAATAYVAVLSIDKARQALSD